MTYQSQSSQSSRQFNLESWSWAVTEEIPHELVNFLMQTAKANNSVAIQLSLALFAARAARDSELWSSTHLVRKKENRRTEFVFLVYYTLDDGFDKCASVSSAKNGNKLFWNKENRHECRSLDTTQSNSIDILFLINIKEVIYSMYILPYSIYIL